MRSATDILDWFRNSPAGKAAIALGLRTTRAERDALLKKRADAEAKLAAATPALAVAFDKATAKVEAAKEQLRLAQEVLMVAINARISAGFERDAHVAQAERGLLQSCDPGIAQLLWELTHYADKVRRNFNFAPGTYSQTFLHREPGSSNRVETETTIALIRAAQAELVALQFVPESDVSENLNEIRAALGFPKQEQAA